MYTRHLSSRHLSVVYEWCQSKKKKSSVGKNEWVQNALGLDYQSMMRKLPRNRSSAFCSEPRKSTLPSLLVWHQLYRRVAFAAAVLFTVPWMPCASLVNWWAFLSSSHLGSARWGTAGTAKRTCPKCHGLATFNFAKRLHNSALGTVWTHQKASFSRRVLHLSRESVTAERFNCPASSTRS